MKPKKNTCAANRFTALNARRYDCTVVSHTTVAWTGAREACLQAH